MDKAGAGFTRLLGINDLGQIVGHYDNNGNVQILAACAIVEGLSSSQVTDKGNQKAFCKLLRNAVSEIGKGHYCKAVEQLRKAIERTDGFPLRNALDKKGDGRDWITDPVAQRAVYTDLIAAQISLTGLPCGVQPGHRHDDDCHDDDDD